MKLGDIRISRAMLCAVIVLFFLPFVTVSCGGQQVSFSGTQLLTGTSVGNQSLGSQFDVVFAFLATVIALAATWMHRRLGQILTIVFAAAGFGWLQFFRIRFNAAIASSQMPIIVSYNAGFWLACLVLVGVAALNVYEMRQRSIPSTAPVMPVLSTSSNFSTLPTEPVAVELIPKIEVPAPPAALIACPSCGSTYEESTRFCMSCGARLQEAS